MAFAVAAGKWVANSREVSQFMHYYFRWSVARLLCLASQWPGSWDGALVDHGEARWGLVGLTVVVEAPTRRDGVSGCVQIEIVLRTDLGAKMAGKTRRDKFGSQ
jgi:hypothetical protein